MSIHVEIPDEIAQWLEEKAKASGSKPEVVAVETLRRQAEADEAYSQLMMPVHKAFKSSGLSEDEAVELFETEKHALRRSRQQLSS
jgi:hypothetical protein